MVGAPGPLAPPPRGGVVDFFCVDGGRSRTSGTTSQVTAVNIFCIDRGRSRTFYTASQGALPSMSFVLMVGAPGPPASPPRGLSLMFFALMMGAPGSLAPPPGASPSTTCN
jgi:hypothetical protein